MPPATQDQRRVEIKANPLIDDPSAVRESAYLAVGANGWTRDHRPYSPSSAEQAIHASLHDMVAAPDFPCVAAKSVFNRHRDRFGIYGQLGAIEAAKAVCHDLYEFSREYPVLEDRFASFWAVFQQPDMADELQFEQLLWRQLQLMHGVDAAFFPWSEDVSNDPGSADFSFCIGQRAFFIVGLHPQASRRARRAPHTVIVFNPHEQFEHLRSKGQYDRLRQAIRSRDVAYQGTINPTLGDFGASSETRQYAGRDVGPDWRCPFHALPPNLPQDAS